MTTDSLDLDFRRYLRTRDPAAMAAVFDAAAPRLLLVAMHLCRDAAAAEDLVQTVFLQVLRDADRFDERRPLLPWLLGILEHRASDLRGRAHARREIGGEVTALARGPAPDSMAADAEARQRIAEALSGMPGEYREILTLRLVHGLRAVEIANAKGVPPATIRTRLHRGLRMLRDALPRGLATPALLSLLAAEALRAGSGMAAVRAQVLAAAASAAATGLGWLFAAMLCVALGAGGWLMRSTWIEVSPRAGDFGVASSTVTGAELEDRAVADGDDHLERLGAPAIAHARTTHLRGRVVDAQTAAPLADAVVSVRTWPTNGTSTAAWRDPEPTTTDASGRFDFAFVPSSSRSVELTFDAEGRVRDFRSFEPLREGVELDVGTVALAWGTPLRVRLSVGDAPLGGITMYATQDRDGVRSSSMGGFGPSDANGELDMGVQRPGTWRYELRTAHRGHDGVFEVPLQSTPFVAKIELELPPPERSISGRVLDQFGAPLAGVDLAIRVSRGLLVATTGLDGGFLWAFGHSEAQQCVVHLPRERTDLEWLVGGVTHIGEHGLQWIARRRDPATLRIEVYDAVTEAPVLDYGLGSWLDGWSLDGGVDPDFKRAAIVRRPAGVATLELPPGPHFVSVFPTEPYAEQTELPVELHEGRTTTLRVPLASPATALVEVVDAATGEPVRGVEVTLAKVVPPSRREAAANGYRIDLERARMGIARSSGTNVLELDRATTDAHGLAQVRAAPNTLALVLFVAGPRCVAAAPTPLLLPRDGVRTTIAVTRAAEIVGVLLPRAFVERFGPAPQRLAEVADRARTQILESGIFDDAYPAVELRSLTDDRRKFKAWVDSEGTFRIGGVEADRYGVWVIANVPTSSRGGGSSASFGPLTEVDVVLGASRSPLEIDLQDRVPGTATVQWFLDGRPWHGKAGLVGLSPSSPSWVRLQTGEDGVARTPWLLPGTYMAYVAFQDERGTDWYVLGQERRTLSADQDTRWTFTLQRRGLTVTVVDGSGRALAERLVQLEPLDHPAESWMWRRWERTDAEGEATFLSAPPGRIRVRGSLPGNDDDEQAVVLGEVSAQATTARVEWR